MHKNSKIISEKELKAGDVLLCYKKYDLIASIIRKVTNGLYSHAAICISETNIAESIPIKGISTVNKSEFLKKYDYVVVLRNPWTWNDKTTKKLNDFVKESIENKKKYNWPSACSVVHRRKLYNKNSFIIIQSSLSNGCNDDLPDIKKYFCSQFVTDCFLKTRIISKNAQCHYTPNRFHPSNLTDPTFGFFVGYITSNESIKLNNDYFYNQPILDEILKDASSTTTLQASDINIIDNFIKSFSKEFKYISFT